MKKGVKSLSLSGFRGASKATEIEMDTSKPMVVIFGENGTGKSTIVDAFDIMANGEAGSLEYLSLPGNKGNYLATVGKKSTDVSIKIKTAQGEWTGQLSRSRLVVSGPDPKPKIHVLRRARLAKLVEAKPAERYEEIRRFVDIEAVETSEGTLREAVRDSKRQFDALSTQLSNAQETLDRIWREEDMPGKTAEEWARTKASGNTKSLAEDASLLDSLGTSLSNTKAEAEKLKTSEATAAAYVTTLEDVTNRIAATPGLPAQDAMELVALLKDAQTYISPSRNVVRCPLCEQPVGAEALRESVEKRLLSMAEYQALREELSKAEGNVARAERNKEDAEEALVTRARELLTTALRCSEIAALGLQLNPDDYASLHRPEMPPKVCMPGALKLLESLKPFTEKVGKVKETIQRDLNQFGLIKTTYESLVDARKRAQEEEALAKRLEEALSLVEKRRKAFADKILDEISGEYNTLFSRLHPGETIGDIRLRLDPNKRGSLEQTARCHGHDNKPPQGYFSESHLDTLGFCVWLANAKRDNPKDAILVLDDIFTSVDAQHITRLVDLLADECASFAQTIITTHYRNWRDRYRLGQGGGGNVQLVELHRWSLERGIATFDTPLGIDELKAKLAVEPFDRQGVGSLAGILLEAMLDRLAILYCCRVPLKRDTDYTLGELWDGCARTLKVICVDRDGTFESILPFVGPVESLDFIRNQVGCHFNLAGLDISNNDVEAFGRATIELGTAVTCDSCGDIPGRRKDTHFVCTCGKTKMTPLQRKT